MRGINKAIVVGSVGQDPELRVMPSGAAVTNLSVATSERWKDKETGQPQERTEWHRIVVMGRLAETVGEYVRKGSKLYVEGPMRTRKWQDKTGQDRYTTEIVATEIQFLDSRAEPAGGGGRARPSENAAGASAQAAPTNSFDYDDDIPF
jgi:single-strand DNA-binding protein